MLAHITLGDLPVMAALAVFSFALGAGAFGLGRWSVRREEDSHSPAG